MNGIIMERSFTSRTSTSSLGARRSSSVVGKMNALLQGSVMNDYREAFSHAPDFNPEVRALLDSITTNQANMRRIDSNFLGSASACYQDESDSSDGEEKAIAIGAEGTYIQCNVQGGLRK